MNLLNLPTVKTSFHVKDDDRKSRQISILSWVMDTLVLEHKKPANDIVKRMYYEARNAYPDAVHSELSRAIKKELEKRARKSDHMKDVVGFSQNDILRIKL